MEPRGLKAVHGGWRTLVVLVFCFLLSPLAAARAMPLNDEEIIDNLVEVVFGSEFVGEDSKVVRKWTGPMRLGVYGDQDGTFTGLVDHHIETVRRLTGIDAARVPQDYEEQNAFILFLDQQQFDAYAKSHLPPGKDPRTNETLACFGLFKTNKASQIVQYLAVIPRAVPRSEINACLIEEMTQVLGLPNDSFDIEPSIFNDDDRHHELTWQDELFLRVLYDERVATGMKRDDFVQVARVVVEELRGDPHPGFLNLSPVINWFVLQVDRYLPECRLEWTMAGRAFDQCFTPDLVAQHLQPAASRPQQQSALDRGLQ